MGGVEERCVSSEKYLSRTSESGAHWPTPSYIHLAPVYDMHAVCTTLP